MADASVASEKSTGRRTPNKRKRKREGESSREPSDTEDSDGDVAMDDDHPRSRLAKRIHSAKSRKSLLSKSIVANPSSTGSPNGSSGPAMEDHGSVNGSAIDAESADDGDAEDSDFDEWADEFEKE